MGYSPMLWGRNAWHFIHVVALSYPNEPTEEEKERYHTFFKSLQEVLPCPICAEHFRNNMEAIPIRLDSPKDLFEWTVDMHNEVNKQNDKPILSYDEALKEMGKNSFEKEVAVGIGKIIVTTAVISALLTYATCKIFKVK